MTTPYTHAISQELAVRLYRLAYDGGDLAFWLDMDEQARKKGFSEMYEQHGPYSGRDALVESGTGDPTMLN